MKRLLLIIPVLILAAILILPTTGIVSAAGPGQTWYLTKSSGPLTGTYLMNQTGPDNSAIPIHKNGDSATWIPDQAAKVNLSFSAATWTVTVTRVDNSPKKGLCTVEVGKCATDGTFTDYGSTTNVELPPQTPFTINVSASAIPISAGEYLALKIINTGDINLEIKDGSMECPGDDPTYPVPEASTIILLSLGVVALGGFVWFGTRRRKVAA